MVYLYVGIGGAIGSLLRYIISQLSIPYWNHFPMGTLFVNLIGAFVLGWFTARILPLVRFNHELKTGFSTGVIGSFTTFSTLSVESMHFIHMSHFGMLFIYLLLSVVGGLTLVATGYLIGERGVNNR